MGICTFLNQNQRLMEAPPKDREMRLLGSNDSARTMACRQSYSAVILFRLLGGAGGCGSVWDVFADEKPPSALRAQGLRVFGEPG
jgi:hypothetical protein